MSWSWCFLNSRSSSLSLLAMSCARSKVEGSAALPSNAARQLRSLVMELRTVPLLFLTPEAVDMVGATTRNDGDGSGENRGTRGQQTTDLIRQTTREPRENWYATLVHIYPARRTIMLSRFLPIATDSSAKSNSHSYISNFIIIQQLSMRNNHNMWQRYMAAQIIISGMFCMTKHQHQSCA